MALKRLWTVAAAEGIICSYNTFSPIIVTEVWLENVKSGLVQLKSSPLRSLLILISGIGCLNRLTNYILSSLIQSLPLFFSCSVRLPDARLSPCLSLFQLKWGLCSEYLNKLKGLFKQKEKKKKDFLNLISYIIRGSTEFCSVWPDPSPQPVFEGQHAGKETFRHHHRRLACSIIHRFYVQFPFHLTPFRHVLTSH